MNNIESLAKSREVRDLVEKRMENRASLTRADSIFLNAVLVAMNMLEADLKTALKRPEIPAEEPLSEKAKPDSISRDDLLVYFDSLSAIACKVLKVNIIALPMRTRKRIVVYARAIISALFKDRFGEGLPLNAIADRFGGLHHTSVLHYTNVVFIAIKKDREYAAFISSISSKWDSELITIQKPGDEARLLDV